MKTSFFICVLLFSLNASAQTFPSSCNASDSLKYVWGKQADRLALRHEFMFNDTYKDSLRTNPQLRKRYRDALIAVYNCTAIPVHDTIFKVLKVVTKPTPEMNSIKVLAASNLPWMVQLLNNQAPVSSPAIANLMTQYNMSATYFQSTPYDAVIFQTDSSLNLPILAPTFIGQAAVSALPENGFDDTRNITDSLTTNFVQLDYSFGWGTCENGCDYRMTWSFKVYNDCSVEYLGVRSIYYYLGIAHEQLAGQEPLVINPVRGQLQIKNLNTPATLRLFRMDGSLVRMESLPSSNNDIEWPSDLRSGLYVLQVETDLGHYSYKLVVETD